MYSSSQLLSTNIWPFKDISLKCDCFNGRPAVELLLLHLVDLLYMVLLFELVQLLGHLEGLLDLGGWSATAGGSLMCTNHRDMTAHTPDFLTEPGTSHIYGLVYIL